MLIVMKNQTVFIVFLATLAFISTSCSNTTDKTSPPEAFQPKEIAIFTKPFKGEWPTTNFFDHNTIQPYTDEDRIQLTWWGEKVYAYIDGHLGYDWAMPEGTELYAVADAYVVFAGWEEPFYCPVLDRKISGIKISLEAQLPTGQRLLIDYGHLRKIFVKTGQKVKRGERIGLSGNTGCSTGPHLHFQTNWIEFSDWNAFDPYGWYGKQMDPWYSRTGSRSVNLWQEAPALYREVRTHKHVDGLYIRAIRYMGPRDETHPNNEFVELFSNQTVSLKNYKLYNAKAQLVYSFPKDLVIEAGTVLKVYSGPGPQSSTSIFMNYPTGIWDNNSDCIQLVKESWRWYLYWGKNECVSPL